MSNNQYQREMAMALETQPPIFKLDVDCFEELFDWLSLKDLHAFGQTCKRMQQVAGYFFRLKYSGAIVKFQRDGAIVKFQEIHCNGIEISGFSDYIENILFDGSEFVSGGCSNLGVSFAKSNELKSLKKVVFRDVDFGEEKFEWMKKFLGKVEIVRVYYCKFKKDFYAEFLQYCTNMKRLVVVGYCRYGTMGYNWLLQHYPKLKQLVLRQYNDYRQIDELKTFFERNPNVQHFETCDILLEANRHSFMTSNVKLDTLLISYRTTLNHKFRDMLNEFHKREVYKRLYLFVGIGKQDVLHQFVPVDIVEKLEFCSLPMHVTLLPFINLKELHLRIIPDDRDMESVAAALINIERVHFWKANPNIIFPFIHRSRKLNHFAIKYIREMKEESLDLTSWNKERGKLAGARKVTVYIPEEVFLATKEATHNKDYRLVEVKRYDSRVWIFGYDL